MVTTWTVIINQTLHVGHDLFIFNKQIYGRNLKKQYPTRMILKVISGLSRSS